MDHDSKLRNLLIKAISAQSSDIHITKRKSQILLEFRTVQGNIEVQEDRITERFIEFLKYKAHIDLIAQLKPQTGRFELQISQVLYSLRVAYVKNNQLETMVIRILNPPTYLKLEDLFIEPIELKRIKHHLNQSSGLILFSGSTGSGKTTSLYCCLDDLQNSKIYTVEDPIEMYRDHIVQFEVNTHLNFGFQEAIKQVLRHDPNVIVIGEIRSPLEASAAIRCALSGHLVLSTIHASSAKMTLKRMEEFGIERELLDETILAIYYQSLHYNLKTGHREVKFESLESSKI